MIRPRRKVALNLELAGKRILIVTADSNFRDFLGEALAHGGAHTLSARGIHESLLTLEEWEFDLVLTDLRLSDGTGLDLTRKIRACGLDTSIALMISYDPTFSEISAFAEGAQIVFQKPFGLGDLLEGLGELFRACATHEQIAQDAMGNVDSKTTTSPSLPEQPTAHVLRDTFFQLN